MHYVNIKILHTHQDHFTDISCGVKIGQNIAHFEWVQSQKSPSSLRNVTQHANTITRQNRDCAPACCVTAWYLFKARARSSFCKWPYPDTIMKLFCVYSEESPLTSFLTGISLLQTVYTVDIFPWNFGVIQVRGFLTNYLDYQGMQWLTSYKHAYMYIINTIQPTDCRERKVIKEPLREFKIFNSG